MKIAILFSLLGSIQAFSTRPNSYHFVRDAENRLRYEQIAKSDEILKELKELQEMRKEVPTLIEEMKKVRQEMKLICEQERQEMKLLYELYNLLVTLLFLLVSSQIEPIRDLVGGIVKLFMN